MWKLAKATEFTVNSTVKSFNQKISLKTTHLLSILSAHFYHDNELFYEDHFVNLHFVDTLRKWNLQPFG